MASRHRLLLRWSWRDLRRRKGLVVLTAVIIAIGTGTYGGLGGSSAWRIECVTISRAISSSWQHWRIKSMMTC